MPTATAAGDRSWCRGVGGSSRAARRSNVVHLPRPAAVFPTGTAAEPCSRPLRWSAFHPTREIHVVYSCTEITFSKRNELRPRSNCGADDLGDLPADVSPIGGMTAPRPTPILEHRGYWALRTHRKSAHEATCYTGQGTGNAARTAARARDGVLHGRCRVGRADGVVHLRADGAGRPGAGHVQVHRHV